MLTVESGFEGGFRMNFVEMMVGEKLREADSALDILGSDRKVLQVACEDFTNYAKFHWELIGRETSQLELTEKLEQLYREDRQELEEFLSVWIGVWFKKWKERVKLLIGEESAQKWNRVSKTINNAEPFWRKLERKQEIKELIVGTLVKNGEICGTEILSENLLKMELGEKRVQFLGDAERVLIALNNALRKGRDMAQSKGPLIFVKIDKGYYGATT
jgi:hypothetical protein